MRLKTAVFLLAGLVTGMWAQQAEDRTLPQITKAPRISAEARKAAETKQHLSVFLSLNRHPQREILERVKGVHRLRLEMAEGRFASITALSPLTGTGLSAAQNEIEQITQQMFRHAADEIKTDLKADYDAMEARLVSLGASNIRRLTFVTVMIADIPSNAIQVLENDPAIEAIDLVGTYVAQIATSVPALGAPSFWAADVLGSGVTVGVIDTGGTDSHPAFGGRSSNFAPTTAACPGGRTAADDTIGHGTHVGGIIASGGTPQFPSYQGVAPAASIRNIKAGCQLVAGLPRFDQGAVLQALDILANAGVRVVNMSMGFPTSVDDPFLARQVDSYVDVYNMLISVAAGNTGDPSATTVMEPGVAYNVATVANAQLGNLGRFNAVNPTSLAGPTPGGRKKPDIAAPGTNISSTNYNFDAFFGSASATQFVVMTGTSMAAAHISGAAALLRNRGITDSRAIKASLLNTAESPGWQPSRGWGFANLSATFSQGHSSNIDLNTVTPRTGGQPRRFYSGPAASSLIATLVWNSHISGATRVLNDLNLSLYSRDTGALIARSNSIIDNVEQVSTQTGGNYVLKVDTPNDTFGITTNGETYAVAFTPPLTARAGPTLGATCTGPPSVAPNSQITVTCSVTNGGDVEVFGATGRIGYAGSQLGPVVDFGFVPPGVNVSRTLTLASPAVPGNYQAITQINANAFDENIATSGAYSFAVSGDACSYNLSAFVQNVDAVGGTGSVNVNAGANCVWDATSTVPWITVTSGVNGTGNGTVSYTVASNNSASGRIGTIAIAGLIYTVVQSAGSGVPSPAARIAVFRNGQWFIDANSNGTFDSGDRTIANFGAPGDRPVGGDWSGSGTAKVGVFRDGIWYLDWNGNNTYDAADRSYAFGAVGDIPVVGDWTGSGVVRIGVYRGGTWFLDINGNGAWDGPQVDATANFGIAGDLPVAGDWTGTGGAKIGVLRNGTWFLDINNNRQFDAADRTVNNYGATGDQPAVGDWSGTGIAAIGIFRQGLWVVDSNNNGIPDAPDRASLFGQNGDIAVAAAWESTVAPAVVSKVAVFRNGVWFADANNNGSYNPPGSGDRSFQFGGSGDQPVAGDWTGDGIVKAGVFRAGVWFLDWNGNGQWDGPAIDRQYSFGIATDRAVAGDWTGSGVSRIGVFRTTGQWFLDLNANGQWDGTTIDRIAGFGGAGDIPVVGDWNGDRITKIGVFRSGTWYFDQNNNGGFDPTDTSAIFGLATDIPVAGDWTGTGTARIGVFRNGQWILDINGNRTQDGADRVIANFGGAGDLPVVGDWRVPGSSAIQIRIATPTDE